MKKLLLILCLYGGGAQWANAQYKDAVASSDRFQSENATGSTTGFTLKDGLTALEDQFNVSIAFKDDLVAKKQVKIPKKKFETVEEGLKEILKDSGLTYEKAGSGFFVIYLKKAGKSLTTEMLKSPMT